VTDRLRSYRVAHRELMPNVIHETQQYANNRAELSHQPIRVRELAALVPKPRINLTRYHGVLVLRGPTEPPLAWTGHPGQAWQRHRVHL
jgi:hypothetical protein